MHSAFSLQGPGFLQNWNKKLPTCWEKAVSNGGHYIDEWFLINGTKIYSFLLTKKRIELSGKSDKCVLNGTCIHVIIMLKKDHYGRVEFFVLSQKTVKRILYNILRKESKSGNIS